MDWKGLAVSQTWLLQVAARAGVQLVFTPTFVYARAAVGYVFGATTLHEQMWVGRPRPRML